MKYNDMLDFYRYAIGLAAMEDDANGFVSQNLGDGTTHPVMVHVDKIPKRLILPTKDNMRSTDWSSIYAFHPLIENRMAGEPPAVSLLKRRYLIRINQVAAILISHALNMANDKSGQINRTADQINLLRTLKNVTNNTVESWNKLIKKLRVGESKTHLFNVYIHKQGKIDGNTFFAVAKWSFPIHSGLKKIVEGKEDNYQEVRFSKKDAGMLVDLLEFMFPFSKNNYQKGSNNENAPFFDVLFQSSLSVMKALDVVSTHLFSTDSLEDQSYLKATFFNADKAFSEGWSDIDIFSRVAKLVIPGSYTEEDPQIAVAQTQHGDLPSMPVVNTAPAQPVKAQMPYVSPSAMLQPVSVNTTNAVTQAGFAPNPYPAGYGMVNPQQQQMTPMQAAPMVTSNGLTPTINPMALATMATNYAYPVQPGMMGPVSARDAVRSMNISYASVIPNQPAVMGMPQSMNPYMAMTQPYPQQGMYLR